MKQPQLSTRTSSAQTLPHAAPRASITPPARQVILGSMPPGFLDYKGRDLRDKLDLCLEKNMWFFTLGGWAQRGRALGVQAVWAAGA